MIETIMISVLAFVVGICLHQITLFKDRVNQIEYHLGILTRRCSLYESQLDLARSVLISHHNYLGILPKDPNEYIFESNEGLPELTPMK